MGHRRLARSARTHALRAVALAWLGMTVVLTVILMTPRILAAALVPQLGWIAVPIAMIIAAVAVVFYPLDRLGDAIVTHLRGSREPERLTNVAEGISIALGEPPGRVLLLDMAFPNVGAFPTSDGVVVMATTGAIEQLRRDELEALVAAQLAGMRDRWCRVATRAELVWWTATVLAFVSMLATPVSMVPAILILMLPRMVEATRDLCADVAAVDATRNPAALSGALRRLTPASAVGHEQKYPTAVLPLSPFLVLPKRGGQNRRSVEVNGKVTRSWTAADEVATELALRADRADALAAGVDPRKFTGREFRRRWLRLGAAAPTSG